MSEKEIATIISEVEQNGKQSSIVAGKLIRLDLFQMGVESWLQQKAHEIADEYVGIADAAMGVAVDDMISRLAGEKLIDDLGIGQSYRFDTDEIQKFKGSVLDTFEVLATYLRVLEIAKQQNHDRSSQ